MGGQHLGFLLEHTFLTWSSFCFVVNAASDTVSVYHDSSFVGSEILPKKSVPVPGGGSVLLGQEVVLDYEETDGHLSLIGEVADLRVWNEALPEVDIEVVAKCGSVNLQPVVSFSPSDWLLNGTATWVTSGVIDNICQLSSRNYISRVFLGEHSRIHATKLCEMLGGRLPALHDVAEENQLKEAIAAYIATADNEVVVCVGANRSDNGWVDQYNGGNIPYLDDLPMHHSLDHTEISLCYFAKYNYWTHFWQSEKTTVVCDIPNKNYTVRGFCKDSTVGRELWQHQTLSGRLIFRQFGLTVLTQDDMGMNWLLETWGEDMTAVTPIRDQELPFGYQHWNVNDKKCGQRDEKLLLVVSNCSSESFTCHDLTCIPKEKLCDDNIDCNDFSDESHCSNKVLLPKGYKALPPASSTTEKFTVECSVEVINYRKFDIKEMVVEVDLSLIFRWKDSRLTYFNLKDGLNVIHINQIEIWSPVFGLYSALGAEATLESVRTMAFLERSGSPLEDDLDTASGGTNSLTILQYSDQANNIA